MQGKVTFLERIKNKDGSFFGKKGTKWFDIDIESDGKIIKGVYPTEKEWVKVNDIVQFKYYEQGKHPVDSRWHWSVKLKDPQPQQASLSGAEMSFDEAALYRAAEKSVESASVSLSGQATTTEKLLDRAEVLFNWITGKVKKTKEELNISDKPEDNI